MPPPTDKHRPATRPHPVATFPSVNSPEDGVHHSQFVTGTSNGGLTAHPGGDRWRWESRVFGGAYDSAPARQRPVYGALNFRRAAAGAIWRRWCWT
ncbi:DUF3626 domain-containing protein [Streptomyces sp. NBC_01537]